MLLNLQNILLQMQNEAQSQNVAIDISIIALIIATISAGGVAGTFILNWWVTRASNRTKYAELLRDFEQNLSRVLEKEPSLKTTEECERFAADYLNILDRIAYLNQKGKVPDEIADYFDNYFSYGLTIIDWYDKIGVTEKTAKKIWHYQIEWAQNHNLKADPEILLPKALREYNTLKKNEEGVNSPT